MSGHHHHHPYDHHTHYTRHPSGSGASASMSMSMSPQDHVMHRGLSHHSIDNIQASPPPRPAPASRMALSALVNSPVEPSRQLSPSPNYPNGHGNGNGAGPSTITMPGDRERERYASPSAHYTTYGGGAESWKRDEHDRYRSARNGLDHTPTPFAMRMGDKLLGNEEVWESGLQRYQRKREAEVDDMAMLLPEDFLPLRQRFPPRPSGTKSRAQPQPHPQRRSQPPIWSDDDELTTSVPAPPSRPQAQPRDRSKQASSSSKRKGKDRTTTGGTAKSAATIEDELLGLVEDEAPASVSASARDGGGGAGSRRGGVSSPPIFSDDDEDEEEEGEEGDEDNMSLSADRFDPDMIVQPSGLTRHEIIIKVERGDMAGLTELDVKAVQDEMWLREKAGAGGAPTNKDGTVRRKPGPAKGWKKLRGKDWDDGRSDTATSIGDNTLNGDAEDEIAALLGDEDSEAGAGAGASTPQHPQAAASGSASASASAGMKKKPSRSRARTDSKKRKAAAALLIEEQLLAAATSDDGLAGGAGGGGGGSELDSEDERMLRIDGGGPAPSGSRGGRIKEPGVGKGRWTRPLKPADEMDLDPSASGTGTGTGAGEMPEQVIERITIPPNSYDPRGVSETEARLRLSLVEDLEKNIWAGICRDIPRMYRVYQAIDNGSKQNAKRTVDACIRNAFAQRPMKPSFKSVARVNKDAITKGKRVVKEMLVFWKKNEKEELAARKKAEKEAADRAKAEEEAREAKRQSRKLNFLLTQTELYSHFIGKKIKTHEAEDTPDQAQGGATPVTAAGAGEEDLALDENGEPLPDIDYDDDNEENLRRHAARGAQAAVQAARDKARAFDDARAKPKDEDEALDLDGDELNFQNPSLGQDSVTITQPKMLMAQLKEYQLKGLTWLGNLYEQGINGILADEMGLGKTIQSISLLAYLAEVHNLWGPFLVIAPASTLHNWQQELARFVPRLKALPYWGSPKDRETLRKIWSRKNMTFSESSPFHILVTSYQLAVQDEKYFQGMKWQYMILDEAQAIKSSSSARWKSLLSLHCRNRLLLTGTPIQNSMHELWALLHFIMPQLFDSHEEFSEWFSKDIENAAGSGGGTLKPEQLRRLHMILKPFMLRRVKKHVQKELGDKIEIDLLVDLSQRQRSIYKALRQRVSIADLIAQANALTDSGTKNLMNLVMQFRKVCNHPDLFERADVVSPFMFGSFSQSGNLARQGDQLYCPDSAANLIKVDLPRLIWSAGTLSRPDEETPAGSDTHVLRNLMSIWREDRVRPQISRKAQPQHSESGFSFARFIDKSPADLIRQARSHPLVSLLHDADAALEKVEDGSIKSDSTFAASRKFAIPPRVPPLRPGNETPLREISTNVWNASYLSRRSARFAIEPAVAPRIEPVISNRSFLDTQTRAQHDPLVHQAMYGLAPSQIDDPRIQQILPTVPRRGLLDASPLDQSPIPSLRVPASQRLVIDSAKLARLDDLLRELKDGGHRVLLYFQMTRMMDLAEEYLIYRQYKYLRLDGSSPIDQRRDMVTAWQTNPDIFVFCLSTRAGGLGINLTAADTVIFYDHDWNPSNDAQAMDRAHRVGQTKQVTVYRLIARGTIEERIVNLARAKKDVQDIVVGTKSLTDVAKPSEIVSLFMDDEELAESVAKRKQAEAHGYVAPSISKPARPSAFADPLATAVAGAGGDDEDDFFSLKRKVPNGEDMDDVPERPAPAGAAGGGAAGAGTGGGSKSKSGGKSKRKAEGEPKRSHQKKVKIALGPDGLPL